MRAPLRDDEGNTDHDDTTTPYTAADRMQRMPQFLSFRTIPTLPRRRLRGSGRTALARVALGLLLPAALAAQEIAPAEYAARRDSLAARLDSGVVVAFGAPTPTGIVHPGQLPAFRYLTGFLEPNAALVLVLRGGRASGTLYTLARDPRRALYDGFMPDSAAIARATGLGARSFAALGPALDSLARSGLPFYSLRDFSGADFAQTDSLTRGAAFLRTFAAAHPGLEPRDAHPVVDSLRARKSPAELALLRRAIDITVAAHRDAHARRAARRLGIRDRRALRLGVPPHGRRRAVLRLDHRLGTELHPVPLRDQQPAHAGGRCRGDRRRRGVSGLRRRRHPDASGERPVHGRPAHDLPARARRAGGRGARGRAPARHTRPGAIRRGPSSRAA